MSNNARVCAVVVTYNRKELLGECLAAISNQSRAIDALYIIDNASTDGTAEYLADLGYIADGAKQTKEAPCEAEAREWRLSEHVTIRVHYVRMHENVGGSGGFHEGVKRAYQKGYDWIWIMDDDGKPGVACLERLLGAAQEGFDYLAPDLVDENGASHFEAFFAKARTDVIGFRGGPFNAILLSRRLVRAVGYPMANFFVWGDEMEYTDRMVEAGFPLVTIREAKHFHKRTTIDYKTCSRGFYYVRNSIYRMRLYEGVYRSKIAFSIGRLSTSFGYILRCCLNLRLPEVIRALSGLAHGYMDPLDADQERSCWWGTESR